MYLPAYKNNALIFKSDFIALSSSVYLSDSIPIFKIIAPPCAKLNILSPTVPVPKFHLMNAIFSAWRLQLAHN